MKTLKPLLWVIASFAALLLVLLASGQRADDLEQSFQLLSGNHWYRLQYRNRNVGHYVSDSTRDTLGQYQFHTILSFTLPGSYSTTIEQNILFATAPPHAMLSASLRENTGNRRDLEVEISLQPHHQGFHYSAKIDRNGDHESRSLTWQYTLHEHLALELWLRQKQPRDLELMRTVQLDLERLALRPLTWQLVSHSSRGYLIKNHSPLEATLYQLDQHLIPQSFTLGGLFRLYKVSGPEALETEPSYRRTSARVALDETLGNPTRVGRLLLEINAPAAQALELAEGLNISAAGNSFRLKLERSRRRPTTETSLEQWRQEEVLFPVNHPRIQSLLGLLNLQPGATEDTLERLTYFVHQQLRYDENTSPITILDALQDGAGDCTEYADLLTTLARGTGFAARTVTGLAYSEQTSSIRPKPGFSLHSWSEIAIDGFWYAVDPTWNQTALDATHIPFPQAPTQQLLAIASIPDMRFKLLQADYF